jgi:hypothetical protein
VALGDLNLVVSAQVSGATQGLKQVDQSLQRVQSSMARANSATKGMTNQFNSARTATQKFATGAMQQAGYQIGDFAVQVANGTSKMQAFGQQGSQLLGIFGPIGAVLGAGVAIISAFAVAAQRSGAATKSFKDALEDSKSALEEYISLASSASAASSDMFRNLKNFADQSSTVINDLIAIEKIKAFESILKLNESLFATVSASGLFNVSVNENITRLLGIGNVSIQTRRKIRGLEQSFIDLRRAGDLETSYEAATRLRDQMLGLVDPINTSNVELRTFYQQLLQSIQTMELLGAATENAMVDNLGDAYKLSNQRIASLTTEDQLMQQIVGRNQVSINMELERANKQVQRITSLDKEDQLMQQIVGLNQTSLEIEQKRKENLDKLVANQASMARIMMSVSLDPEERLMARGVGIDEASLAKAKEYFAELERAAREAAKIGDPLGDLTKRISAERELLRVSDAERQVRMAIYDADRKYSPEMVQNAINLVKGYQLEVNALEEVKATNEAVANTIENSMTDAFMSIVDGTKKPIEAFKDMARLIIAELYKVLVVKQLVGSFDSATGSGTGLVGMIMGAFGGFRANGGPVSGGTPYIVGERGPELFVPSRSGTIVPNGAGGGVTVIQNNTFGNGVSRAEIQSMLPRIVETTKAAVFDAQRRSVNGLGYA